MNDTIHNHNYPPQEREKEVIRVPEIVRVPTGYSLGTLATTFVITSVLWGLAAMGMVVNKEANLINELKSQGIERLPNGNYRVSAPQNDQPGPPQPKPQPQPHSRYGAGGPGPGAGPPAGGAGPPAGGAGPPAP